MPTGVLQTEHGDIPIQRIGILIDHLTSGMEWLEISSTGEALYRAMINEANLRNFVTPADGRLFVQSGTHSSSRGPTVA